MKREGTLNELRDTIDGKDKQIEKLETELKMMKEKKKDVGKEQEELLKMEKTKRFELKKVSLTIFVYVL